MRSKSRPKRPPSMTWPTWSQPRMGRDPARLDRRGTNWHECARYKDIKTRETAMKAFLIRFFTWWNGQTFGTQVWTSLYGEFVGEDEFGNRYYRTKGGKIDPVLLFERRWVIYNGIA